MKHTVSGQAPPTSELGQQLTLALGPVLSQEVDSQRRPCGRPRLLSESHLWLSLLLCVLSGMHSYQDWWRWLRSTPIGPFQPLALTDDALVKRLKPAPKAYRMVAERLGVAIGEIRLIAAHAWDIAGALRAGCAAAFMARQGMVLDPLFERPDVTGSDLREVAERILEREGR